MIFGLTALPLMRYCLIILRCAQGAPPHRRICSIHVLKEMIHCIKEVSLWENGLLEIQFGIDPVRARNWSPVERKKCLFFPLLIPKHVSVNSIGHRIKQPLSCSAITERNSSVRRKSHSSRHNTGYTKGVHVFTSEVAVVCLCMRNLHANICTELKESPRECVTQEKKELIINIYG